MKQQGCPIWGTPATVHSPTRDGEYVDSPRTGGEYFISGTAVAMIAGQAPEVKARLTTWLIEQRRLGVLCPIITSYVISEAEQRHPLTIGERTHALMHFLATLPRYLGDRIHIELTNVAEILYGPGHTMTGATLMAHSESLQSDEVDYLLAVLEKQGYIEPLAKSKGAADYVITVEGYAHLAALESSAVVSKQAFVAMWFDDSLRAAYADGIAVAIRGAGYEPLRIDQKEHNNRIDDEIVAEIRRSRFVVADFTHGDAGARGGVYYEAGLAHGLKLPVIFTCRADAIGKVHFDTRQYSHILWQTPAELAERLGQRISATIGDGPLKQH